MTSREITWNLVKRHSLFDFRSNLLCIPNVSWGFLEWEADLLILSKSKYLTEIEIKISSQDWKKEIDKRKWARKNESKSIDFSWSFIKNFYYAAPLKLAEKYREFHIKKECGVIGINDLGSCIILKEAKIMNKNKLEDKSILKLARLSSMRTWKGYQNASIPKR